MNKRIATVFLLSFFISSACFAEASKTTYFWNSIVHPPEHCQIQLYDGYQSLYYQLKLGQKKSDTVIFFFTGSGMTSLRYILPTYFKGFKGDATVYALQKRHIKNWGLKKGKEFDQDNYLEKWIDDDDYFINYILKNINTSPKKIVAFGVSEGGSRAIVAAAKFKEITHLVVLGNGGLKQADELKILSRYYGGTPEKFDFEYSKILAEPESTEKFFLGWPYKYWSHVLFFDPLPYYLQIEDPIFVAFGEKDRSSPVEAGEYLRDKFAEQGKQNLCFLEIRDCGHSFEDSEGISHKSEVFDAIVEWMNK